MAVTCASCGQENREGASFCDNCGHGLASGCPKCGVENRAGARFFSGCGSPLSVSAATFGAAVPAVPKLATSAAVPDATPSASVAERRIVSVLFADLVALEVVDAVGNLEAGFEEALVAHVA
jgi:hypothetical protein